MPSGAPTLRLISPEWADRPGAAFPAEVAGLQSASHTIWSNFRRGVTRVTVLVGCDLVLCLLLRVLIRAARTGAVGMPVAELAGWAFPTGFLGGTGFLGALLLSLAITGSYGSGRARRDPSRLLAAASLAALIGLYGGLWHPGLFWPTLFRGAVVVAVFTLGLIVTRAAVDALVWHVRPWVAVTRVVVVTHTDDDWRDVALMIRRVRDLVVVGNVTLTRNGDGGRGVHPRLRQLRADIRDCRAEMLILWGNLTDAEYGYALDVALSTGCRLVVGAPESLGGVKPHDVWVAGRQLVELTPPSLRGWQLALKRAMDLIGATAGLLLSAPLFAAITVAILLEDGPPVFFRQRRVGWGGRPFEMLKFRSMVTDAEERLAALKARNIYPDGRLFKLPDDPRVTRVGRFLRRNSLDELPQLLNVLAGSMSLVGPRPPIPSEVETYEERHYFRFHVKPGITGPWQAGGRNGITDFEEVVGLERRYIRSWSVMEDLRILLRTVPAVLRGSGAH